MTVITADFYNASRTVQYNTGPVFLNSASRSEMLDAVGTFNFEVDWLDRRVRDLVQPQRFVSIQVFTEDGKWEPFASGFIEQIKSGLTVGSTMKTVSCMDSMQELKYFSALLARIYSAVTLQSAVEDLVSRPGWTADYSGDPLLQTSSRFDGPNILKCLITLTKTSGLHFRKHPFINKRIQFGALGDANPTILTNADTVIPNKEQIAIIENLTLSESSDQLINRVIPLGGGEGGAAQTLKESTRDNILTMVGPDGNLIYFIENDLSVTLYGVKEAVVAFKEVQAVENTTASRIAASNLLYDSAMKFLQQNGEPIRQYTFSIATPTSLMNKILPGQRIEMKYTGPVRDLTGGLHIEETYISETFWVLSVKESVGEGRALSITVSTIDKLSQSEDEVLASLVEKAQASVVRVQPYPCTFIISRFDVFGVASNGTGARNGRYLFRINDQFAGVRKILATILPAPIFVTAAYDVASPGAVATLYGVYGVAECSRWPIVNVFLISTTRTITIAENLGSLTGWTPVTYDLTPYILSDPGGIYQDFGLFLQPVAELIDAAHDVSSSDFNPPNTFDVGQKWTTVIGGPYFAGSGVANVDFIITATVQGNI